MAQRRDPPSVDLQRRAYALLRRPGWPATYEDAMASPLHAGLVRARATGLAMDQQAADRRRLAMPARAPAPRPLSPTRSRMAAGAFDARRAAANDLADDTD